MIKILICDDEAIIRQGIRKILENFYGDIEVRECGDGMEGYKTMAVWNPDAVITDIRMPVLDGLAMIEKALAAGITTQYVVISAYRDFEYARTAIRYDVADYVLKLSVLEELPPAVEKVTQKLQKQKKELEEQLVRMPEKKAAESLYDQIQEYIEKNYSQKITLNDMAEELHANSSYLSRLYKKESGQNLFDVILKKRIEKAKVYMETTDKKIYEISQSVGFDDTGYFSRIFKRYTGVSPKEYQSGKRGGDEE